MRAMLQAPSATSLDLRQPRSAAARRSPAPIPEQHLRELAAERLLFPPMRIASAPALPAASANSRRTVPQSAVAPQPGSRTPRCAPAQESVRANILLCFRFSFPCRISPSWPTMRDPNRIKNSGSQGAYNVEHQQIGLIPAPFTQLPQLFDAAFNRLPTHAAARYPSG